MAKLARRYFNPDTGEHFERLRSGMYVSSVAGAPLVVLKELHPNLRPVKESTGGPVVFELPEEVRLYIRENPEADIEITLDSH